jgi:uncharacterized protein (TIGR03435 family)
MQRVLTYVSAITFLSCVTFGQSLEETVSIVQKKSGGPPSELRTQADGLTGTNVTLRQLMVLAYHLNASQLQGPSWIDSEGFDITVKAEDTSGGPALGLRLQTILTDRFKLKVHRETKNMPVYFLVVANGGPKLRDAKEGEDAFNGLVKNGNSPFKPYFAGIFKGCDLPAFAERLGRSLDRPVVDKTGIQGKYWFQLEWPIGSGPDSLNPSSSLLAVMRDQLGLALENQAAPQDVLVIDQAEKP